MEILSFEGGAQAPRKKKSLGLILGVAIVAGVTTLGSTLAATVTIEGGNIAFGQGVVQATACDSEITLTPATTFVNATGAGAFRLSTITLGKLDDACDGKKLIVKAYNDVNASSALVLVGTSDSISATYNKTTPTSSTLLPATGVALTGSTASANNGTLVLLISSPVLNATSISKLTIEQQN